MSKPVIKEKVGSLGSPIFFFNILTGQDDVEMKLKHLDMVLPVYSTAKYIEMISLFKFSYILTQNHDENGANSPGI